MTLVKNEPQGYTHKFAAAQITKLDQGFSIELIRPGASEVSQQVGVSTLDEALEAAKMWLSVEWSELNVHKTRN